MENPLSPEAAAEIVDEWLAAPAARMPDITAASWTILSRMLTRYQVSGSLVPDAQLAALAIQYGVPVVSADSDFARFTEVTWINPCTR